MSRQYAAMEYALRLAFEMSCPICNDSGGDEDALSVVEMIHRYAHG